MAGQPKRGLEYVGWNVHIFEDDTRIDELLDSQGWNGYAVYHYLFLKASGSEGYFYRWSYSNAATTARKMGGGIRSETVKQTVSLCLHLGLFDDRLFDKEGILTSKEIQLRYMLAIGKRSPSGRTVEPKYWLLNRDETADYIIIPSNVHSLPEDTHSLPENDTKESKANESKANESKADFLSGAEAPDSRFINLPLNDKSEFSVSENMVSQWEELYPAVDIRQELRKMKGWLDSNPKRRKTRKGIKRFITNWLSNNQDSSRSVINNNSDKKEIKENEANSRLYQGLL